MTAHTPAVHEFRVRWRRIDSAHEQRRVFQRAIYADRLVDKLWRSSDPTGFAFITVEVREVEPWRLFEDRTPW